MHAGRIRVQLYDCDGSPCNPKVPNSESHVQVPGVSTLFDMKLVVVCVCVCVLFVCVCVCVHMCVCLCVCVSSGAHRDFVKGACNS